MSFDIIKARENLQRRQEQRRRRLHSLFDEALQDARKIAAMLIGKYHPCRMYQWGSLLDPARFREWSDIDFALEGLAGPLDGLHAIDDAASMTRFPVDIVELERIHPQHAESIRREGRLIYERQ